MEELVLVDEYDRATGTAEKMQVHRDGLLHRAFSIFIFDLKGRLLLQKRALGKYHSQGLWTNTCCGHPRPGEPTLAAARRRLLEEMGIDCPVLMEVEAFVYRTQVSNGLIENEYDHIYVGLSRVDPKVNPDEAMDWRWSSLHAVFGEIRRDAAGFTVWLQLILRQHDISTLRGWYKQLRERDALIKQNRKDFALPPRLQRLSFALSPHAQAAERHTRQWLIRLGLEDGPHARHQLDIYQPGLYAGYMWPDADCEDLPLLAQLTGWFSCQDDLADEDLSQAPELLEQAIRDVHEMASSNGTTCCIGLAGGLADIIQQAGAQMPPQWRQRTLEQYESYLYPCLRAAMHRLEGSQPAEQDFESVWRNAGGFQVCVEFNYFADRVHLPSRIYYSDIWQELRRVSLNLLKAVNDLLSFSIMENPMEDVYNLLTHLIHHRQCSPREAAGEVRHRIDAWAGEFLKLQRRLPRELDRLECDDVLREQVLRSARTLKVQWHGNIAWHLAVPRYREVVIAAGAERPRQESTTAGTNDQ
ncbi:isopentenyl-diphosphate Delta-isomerase [Pseudomonas fitomaticsae]|uniref:isopentenyl-diphosphate Delta-isomerase n=1 Tax=Pseudomonas fitomaticsae TaxID=2837969 RepID=UPI001E3AA73C|nr:isopentenyl-diphosphate Delta-isomerase [Pseudomonas fitomaticsae]